MSYSCIDFEAELNPRQFEAVSAPYDVPSLVLAGAGSGKTRTLTYRIAYLIERFNLAPENLLLLTFTNKAAREMLQRTEVLTGLSARSFWGGTFHSIASRFLRINADKVGLESNFSIMDAEDANKLLKESVEAELPKFFSNKNNPKVKLLREIISYSINTCMTIEQAMFDRFSWLETSSSDIDRILSAYNTKKRENNLCDFDDLLQLWLRLLDENPDILERYQHKFKNILVDEYQDTNLLQSTILDKLSSCKNISAVGDDAQCIYTWRGAHIENILNFTERYPNANIFKIENNYRSSPQILSFANSVLRAMPQYEVYEKKLLPVRDDMSLPRVIRATDARSQAIMVADKIEEIAKPLSDIKYSDMAILYRAHKHSLEMQLAMQRNSLPFVITSGLKFFEYAHIKDAISQLRFCANPKDTISFARFVQLLPKLGRKTVAKIYDKALLCSLNKDISIPEALLDKTVLSAVPKLAKELYEDMAKNILTMHNSLRAEKEKKEVQIDLFEALAEKEEDKKLSLLEIIELTKGYWYESYLKTNFDNWQERLGDFDTLEEYASKFQDVHTFLESASLEISEAENSSNQEKPNCVRMMTIHQSKGLEFKVIFLIGTADGMFPLERAIEEDNLEEEQRLFYVACTRAMDSLYLAYPRMTLKHGSFIMCEQSRFIDDVDSCLYTTNF